MSEIFKLNKVRANGCPISRYSYCAAEDGVCDFLALVRTGENKGAFCMANANNQERYDFVKEYPNDNGFVLNTLKEQGYEKN